MEEYSKFPPPHAIIVEKNPQRTLSYLHSLSIKTPFDMTIFLHQVRASRPARYFEASISQDIPIASLHVDSTLWQGSFQWDRVKSTLDAIVQAFTDRASLRSITLNEMIAICLLSEFLAYPVVCEWHPNSLAAQAWKAPTSLQRLFPWNSQLWIHICSESNDREQMLDRGLNPALVVHSKDIQNRQFVSAKLCSAESYRLAEEHVQIHQALDSLSNEHLVRKLNTRKPYIPGLNKLAYFSQVRSSQDSLSFYCEEQALRREMFEYSVVNSSRLDSDQCQTILHAIDTLFALKSGKMLSAVSDCSFAYRHRSRQDHKYTHLTRSELMGLVRQIARTVCGHDENRCRYDELFKGSLTLDGRQLIERLAGGSLSKLDDSTLIIQQLETTHMPLACFLDGCPIEAISLFMYLPLMVRLGQPEKASPVYVFTSTRKIYADSVDHRLLERLIQNVPLLHEGVQTGLLKIVRTQQISEGVNIRQIGEASQRILLNIQSKRGVLLSSGEKALLTLKNLAMPWINIGQVSCEQVAALSGLGKRDGYAIAHLTPSLLFVGFPIVNRNILEIRQKLSPVPGIVNSPGIIKRFITGETADGSPYSGIFIKIPPTTKCKYHLDVELSPTPQPLPVIVEQYQRRTGHRAILAWNGGYFVSKHLQENRDFPSTFYGKPVGLVKIGRKVPGLPLFDRRPVFTINSRGNWDIQTLNLDQVKIGIQGPDGHRYVVRNCQAVDFTRLDRCQVVLSGIQGTTTRIPQDFVAISFLFGEILEVLDGENQNSQLTIPHHTILLPRCEYRPTWQVGSPLSFSLDEYDNYHVMIEAGPQLIRDGQPCLDLKGEHWTDPNSKALQAAPVHYSDLRTARTAFCTLKGSELATFTINSRTDESVGLTHRELIRFIQETLADEVEDAMEFDSGGSVTLMAEQELLSICSIARPIDSTGCSPNRITRPISTAIVLAAT